MCLYVCIYALLLCRWGASRTHAVIPWHKQRERERERERDALSENTETLNLKNAEWNMHMHACMHIHIHTWIRAYIIHIYPPGEIVTPNRERHVIWTFVTERHSAYTHKYMHTYIYNACIPTERGTLSENRQTFYLKNAESNKGA
jgi:hypothetical protein